MIKILIVDDHEIVRLGLRELLSTRSHFHLVGEAANAEEAIQKAAMLKPNVVVMDVRLPDKSGIEACKDIIQLAPDIKVIMLTSFPDDDAVIDAINAGAAGFVLKVIKGNSLIEAIDSIAEGKSLLDPYVTSKVLSYLKNREQEKGLHEILTSREINVLSLVAKGKANKDIAKALYLSERTVRNHLSSIFRKLNFSNRTEAAAYYSKMVKNMS